MRLFDAKSIAKTNDKEGKSFSSKPLKNNDIPLWHYTRFYSGLKVAITRLETDKHAIVVGMVQGPILYSNPNKIIGVSLIQFGSH